MSRRWWMFGVGAPLVGVAVAVCAVRASAEPPPLKAAQPFDVIYAVLLSPRCRNCHPAGDAPLQGDVGRPHAMNVTRTSAASGLACQTCHRATNADFPHGPPGVPGWRLPDAAMPLVFEGKSAHELCEQMKDPARNGHKSLAELKEHFGHDPFIRWGWQPGPGRTVPPVTHAEMMRNVEAWVAAGGPCP